MAPIKTAVLGAGLSLQAFHWPLIASAPTLFTLHSVFDRSAKIDASGKTISSKAYDKCGSGFKVVNTLEGVTSDPEVELVVIGVPNVLHYSYGKACLEAGKHVLMEKPLTVTHAETLELISIAKAKGLQLCAYQNRRWDSDFLAVQEIINSGKIGQINQFESHFDRYRPLATAGGWKEAADQANDAIYNLGAHIIDQALVLFGKPDKVTCFAYDIRQTGLDESFLMHLHYPASHPLSTPSPLIVTLQASIVAAFTDELRFRVSGSKGSFLKYGLDGQEGKLRAFNIKGIKVGDEGWGVEPESEWGVLETQTDGNNLKKEKYPSPNGRYQVLYQNLHDAIKGTAELFVKPEQAALTMQVIELGIKSSKEGRSLTVE